MSNLPHYLIRMPNWLGDVVMALPAIQALQKQRNCHLSLLIQPQFLELAKAWDLADEYLTLPAKSWRYYFAISDLRKYAFDAQILFANSERSDLEARLIAAPRRYGIEAKRRRYLLTDVISSAKTPSAHQSWQLGEFLYAAGFLDEVKLDLNPRKFKKSRANIDAELIGTKVRIGLICGTENMPSKRWSIANWRELSAALCRQIDGVEIRLFGTKGDSAITQQVVRDMPANVVDMAGATSLSEFCQELLNIDVLVCNDTGAMHLANALGTKVVAIFGPTNPMATGPIFAAGKTILQPPNCAPTGGGDINLVEVATVLAATIAALA